MVNVRLLAGSVFALTLGCGSPRPTPASNDSTPSPEQLAQVSNGGTVEFKEVNGGIRGVTTRHPLCPVTAHYDGVLQVTKLSGKLRYRWERSVGHYGPVEELTIPEGAMNGPVNVAVKKDEWPINDRGQQVTVSNRIHVLSPVNKTSPAIDLEAKCY